MVTPPTKLSDSKATRKTQKNQAQTTQMAGDADANDNQEKRVGFC